MDYRTIVNNQESIKKLKDSNAVPWEAALDIADFIEDVEKVSLKYSKAFNIIQVKYGKLAEMADDNINTVDEQDAKNTELEELLDRETDAIRIPELEADAIKKLYKIRKDKDKENDETIEFTIEDIKAFKVLGIFLTE